MSESKNPKVTRRGFMHGAGALAAAAFVRCKNQRSSNPTGLFCPKIDREEHPCK